MAFKVLIMGLPGAGKTYIARYVNELLWLAGKSVTWLNADKVREANDDWDFSTEGRIRQSVRMRTMADLSKDNIVLCDFVAPFVVMRENFDADFTVWVDTIKAGRFEDTNKVFVPPTCYDYKVDEQNHLVHGKIIAELVLEQIWQKQQDEA